MLQLFIYFHASVIKDVSDVTTYVMGWTASSQNSYVEILTPSTWERDPLWKQFIANAISG